MYFAVICWTRIKAAAELGSMAATGTDADVDSPITLCQRARVASGDKSQHGAILPPDTQAALISFECRET